jgi:hypothetical protein
VSYLLQARAREQEALALRAQTMQMEGEPPTVAEVLAEFDEWLVSGPSEPESDNPQDQAQRDLDEAMGVRRRV